MNTKQMHKLLLVSLLSSVSFQSVVAASASDDVGSRGPSVRGMALAVGAAFASTVAGATGPKLTDTVTSVCADGRERTATMAMALAYHCVTPTAEEMCAMVKDSSPSIDAVEQMRALYIKNMQPVNAILAAIKLDPHADKDTKVFYSHVRKGAKEYQLGLGITATDPVTRIISLAAARDYFNQTIQAGSSREAVVTSRLVTSALEKECGYPVSESFWDGMYHAVRTWVFPPQWNPRNSDIKNALAGSFEDKFGCKADAEWFGTPKHTLVPATAKLTKIVVDNPVVPGHKLTFYKMEEARAMFALAGVPYTTEKPGMFARALDSLSCWWNPSEKADGIDMKLLAEHLARSASKNA